MTWFQRDEIFGMNRLFRLSGAVTHSPAIDVWLYQQAPDLGAIARKWFLRMRKCGDDVTELMHDGCPVACVRDAPFAYVNVFRAHASVGFFCGADLDDPTGLLQGAGKRMRHVKVKPGVEPNVAALSALIEAAYVDIRLRLAAERSIPRPR
jgi:hypothetical protein